jgi:hypothetical protein
MAKLSKKEIQRERILNAYFHYWKLQNNPAYVDFYRRWQQHARGKDETPFKKILSEAKIRGYPWETFGPQSRTGLGRLVCPIPFVDPFKKIEWRKVSGLDDLYFWETFNFNPHSVYESGSERTSGPFLKVSINPYGDKKNILFEVSEMIDDWKKLNEAPPGGRHFLNKFPLYAQVWDLRRGPNRKTPKEICAMLNLKSSTVKSRYYRAFELLHGRAYNRDFDEKARRNVPREALKKTCDICPEKGACAILCPDVLPYINQDWKERHYREVQPSKNPTVLAHLGLSK